MELHHVALEIFTAFLEIEARYLDFLSVEKVVQLAAEQI